MEACGVVVRGDRRLLRVHGRAPAQMLNGILTSRIPGAPAGGVGDAVYGTILTAGRCPRCVPWLAVRRKVGSSVANARMSRQTHWRFLPQASMRRARRGTRLLTVVGPGAGETVAAVFGAAPESGFALQDGGPLGGGALVARGVRQVQSWDVWAGADALSAVWPRLREHGAVPVGSGAWDTLRVEAGYPEFGIDMDDGTIPVEAGLVDVAFDHGKGCYTGQEVIVRIRHRGRVNWHLRPRFGTWLRGPGGGCSKRDGLRAEGVTSVADAPRIWQVIGLAMCGAR